MHNSTNDNSVSAEDAQFIRELFESEYTEMRHVLISMLISEDDADDCIEQIFDIALKNVTKLKEHDNPKGFLYTTLKYCAKNRRRKRIRQSREISLSDAAELPAENSLYAPDESTIFSAKRECLSRLSSNEYALYEMYYEQGLSMSEIAQKNNITISALKMRLHRLRVKLTRLARDLL